MGTYIFPNLHERFRDILTTSTTATPTTIHNIQRAKKAFLNKSRDDDNSNRANPRNCSIAKRETSSFARSLAYPMLAVFFCVYLQQSSIAPCKLRIHDEDIFVCAIYILFCQPPGKGVCVYIISNFACMWVGDLQMTCCFDGKANKQCND